MRRLCPVCRPAFGPLFPFQTPPAFWTNRLLHTFMKWNYISCLHLVVFSALDFSKPVDGRSFGQIPDLSWGKTNTNKVQKLQNLMQMTTCYLQSLLQHSTPSFNRLSLLLNKENSWFTELRKVSAETKPKALGRPSDFDAPITPDANRCMHSMWKIPRRAEWDTDSQMPTKYVLKPSLSGSLDTDNALWSGLPNPGSKQHGLLEASSAMIDWPCKCKLNKPAETQQQQQI